MATWSLTQIGGPEFAPSPNTVSFVVQSGVAGVAGPNAITTATASSAGYVKGVGGLATFVAPTQMLADLVPLPTTNGVFTLVCTVIAGVSTVAWSENSTFSPSMVFSDSRNSQYVGAIL